MDGYQRRDTAMHRWMLNPGVSSPDGLVLQEVDAPEPGAGQVRIRVTAISLNARDAMILAGPFGRLPEGEVVPLSDVAGVIDAVGAEAGHWSVGDRVMTAHAPQWRDGRPVAFGIG